MKNKNHFTMFAALAILLALGQPIASQVVTNQETGEQFNTIQGAIDDAQTLDGHTLRVGPGEYFENVIVDKELTILGPKQGIPGYSPIRGSGEAVLYPPYAWYGDGTYNGGYLMRVTADNVTIDGLTLDGDNPDLDGGEYANTGAWDIDFGIMSYWSYWYDAPIPAPNPEDPPVPDPALIGDNLTVSNNILSNFRINTLILGSAGHLSAHSFVEDNLVQNGGANGAVSAGDNHYVTARYNTIIDCGIGLGAYWYYVEDPLGIGGAFENNVIALRTYTYNGVVIANPKGIEVTFIYAAANSWTVRNNTVTFVSTGDDQSAGIVITIDQMSEYPLVIQDNYVAGFEYGYRLSMNVFGTTISGGTLNNNRYGVTVSNWNYNGNYPASFADFTVIGLDILNSQEAGVYVEDHPSALEPEVSDPYFIIRVDNCTIDGSPYGVLVDHPDGNAFVHETDLSGNDVAIANFSPQTVDAACNWYGHWTGPDHAPPSNGQGQEVDGLVDFAPWLIEGVDLEPVTSGFQPDPEACVLISCGNNGNKFLVCHNGTTKCVGYADLLVHLSHGDPLGACAEESYQVDSDSPFDGMTDAALPEVAASPNPFDRQLTITYEVPEICNVVLRIYDATGREVHAADLGEQAPGTFSREIRTYQWSPGLYVYRINFRTAEGTEEITGKMIRH